MGEKHTVIYENKWQNEDGTLLNGVRITEGTAAAEYVELNGERICVYANIDAWLGEGHKVNFFLHGLFFPRMWVIENRNGAGREWKCEYDSPRLFEEWCAPLLSREIFLTEPGQLFLSRIGDVLNYTWKG